jgi:hypothetical protein
MLYQMTTAAFNSSSPAPPAAVISAGIIQFSPVK